MRTIEIVDSGSITPLLVRPTEAARLLAISRSQVYAMVARGQLPACRIGTELRLSVDGLRAWVAAREHEAGS